MGYTSKSFMDTYVMTTPTYDWPKALEWDIASWTTASQPALPAWMTLINNPRTWDYWQHSSKGDGKAYGAQSTYIDLQRSRLQLAAFNEKYKMNLQPIDDNPTPPPPPPPPPDGTFQMTVTAPKGLNVRSGPGTEYAVTGSLTYGVTVNVGNVGGQSAWVEIEPGKWACVQFGDDRYMKPD